MNGLDFNVDSIKKNNIELMDCQVDLILRSLEFYSYTYNYIYPRRGKSETLEENLRKSLVRDTYHQIMAQLHLNEEQFDGYNKFKKEFNKVA